MIRKLLHFFFFLFLGNTILLGQEIADFELVNVDGEMIALSSYLEMKAVVVVFTSNHCVYSKKYEDRIVSLAATCADKNVQLLLINSNDPLHSDADRMEAMKEKSEEKGYTFPYLKDEGQKVADFFGATKNPESFVLLPTAESFKIFYKGRIDDNPLIADKVETNYLRDAIDAALAGSSSESTDAVGCNIKRTE